MPLESLLPSTHLVMFLVYALKSLNRNYIYVGLTDNIERRIRQHNSGQSKTIKPYAPFELIYTKGFETRMEARMHEKYLKQLLAKGF